MSGMEIALIVAAVAVPIVTLFLVLPKKKKEAKEESAEKLAEKSKDNVVVEKAEKVESKSKPELKDDANTVKPIFDSVDYKAEDFKDYLKEKSKTTSRPKRKVMGNNFKDLSTGLENYMQKPTQSKKTLADELCFSSTEMQAVIFAGLLDKKF